MTTFTRAELAVRVLRDLGLYGAEETPSAADQVWAEETVGSEILLLSGKGIPVWNGGTESIPEDYLTVLSRRIGLAVAPSYGLVDIATATMAMEACEHNLRILGQTGPTGEVQTAEHF